LGPAPNNNGALSVANGGVGSTTQTEGSFGIGFTAGNLQLGVLLEALESKGLVRTLAEPNLTALSGQEAKFLAGGEYPIPVSQDNNTVSRSNTRPLVSSWALSRASWMATSSTSPSRRRSPASTRPFRSRPTVKRQRLPRREANTTVEMRDGESFAIAGLLQDDFRDLNGQVPWLGDVPILGALFRSADYTATSRNL
jgi:pilus assembly protein CpaC